MLERPSRERPARPRRREQRHRRRQGAARAILVLVLLVLTFLLGMSVARTLDERPAPGGVVTDVRTLAPLPLEAPPRTVTVTVTSP